MLVCQKAKDTSPELKAALDEIITAAETEIKREDRSHSSSDNEKNVPALVTWDFEPAH